MAQLPALTRLYQKISDNLSDADVSSLRSLLVPEILGVARVQHATALQIFKMLQADNKISKGNLNLLVQLLRSLGKGRLAEEAERLQQEQKTEAQQGAAAAMHETNPMSEARRTLLRRNHPTIYQELDATSVLGHLYQEGVLTGEMREEILAIPEERRHDRTRRLLDLILQGDDRAFTVFCKALEHAGYPHLKQLLTGRQQELMIMPPNTMALAIYQGIQGGENFHMSSGEQITQDDQLNIMIPNEHLLTAYQKEQVRQLKKRMKNELKELYRYQKKQVKLAHKKLSQESFERKFDQIQAEVKAERAIIVSKYSGCVILFLTFESEPDFAHFWGSCVSGRLSASLTELLITEEMRRLEGGDQLGVRTLVLEQDYTAWRDYFGKGNFT
ncbi:uncharacterized protein LOC144903076 [Branchiostoma floridae x Branchiostoma belcheri]